MECGMSDEERSAPDLRGLDGYEVRGELRGTDATRYYIGRTRTEPTAEVVIAVVRPPVGGEKNDLSHYAADAQILQSGAHPGILRVLEGRWVGNDSYALVSERAYGETLDELLERG